MISPFSLHRMLQVIDTSGKILASQREAPCFGSIELYALLCVIRACCPASVTQHQAIITFGEGVLETSTYALVGVDTGKQQGSDVLALEIFRTCSLSAPQTRHAIFVDPDVLTLHSTA